MQNSSKCNNPYATNYKSYGTGGCTGCVTNYMLVSGSCVSSTPYCNNPNATNYNSGGTGPCTGCQSDYYLSGTGDCISSDSISDVRTDMANKPASATPRTNMRWDSQNSFTH